ncbi:MAG: hypothetical protein ABSF59_00190 [Candidatus Sulfotelmatobacter sp.]|jgi:hypothetical protein
MKSTEAWGWLVAGVLALGLNGMYHDGGAACAARSWKRALAPIVSRSGAVLALASGRADWFLAKANVAAAREETASCRLATAVARFQTKLARSQSGWARFEAVSARQEIQLARMEADRARIEAQAARVRFTPAAFETSVCPRVKVRNLR